MSLPPNSITTPADRGQCQAIDLIQKIDWIDGHWQPRVVAEMNGHRPACRTDGGGTQGRRAQAHCVLRGEDAVDRAARRGEYGRWRAAGGADCRE